MPPLKAMRLGYRRPSVQGHTCLTARAAASLQIQESISEEFEVRIGGQSNSRPKAAERVTVKT